MGQVDDPDAVVDAAGRVHHVDQLRVVDASIMPVATNGNTNCPTIMLAEKLSDAIMGKEALRVAQNEVKVEGAAAVPELEAVPRLAARNSRLAVSSRPRTR